MAIQNAPKITGDQPVSDMRSAIEHRATWMCLLLDEAERAGLPWEALGRKAVSRCGKFHGATRFTPTRDLPAFAREFANPLYRKIFEMEVREASAERFEVHFHYCPLVAAWQKQGLDDRKCQTLCDIAMDGDRGIASAFPAFRFELGETIAKGDRFCRIVFRKEQDD
ncbi:MAG: L-2-amino-thiazoline-4-carboxylic acid hydrolase [Candidatus Methylomirabilales bacterium]